MNYIMSTKIFQNAYLQCGKRINEATVFNFTVWSEPTKSMAQPRDLYDIGPVLLGWLFFLLPWTPIASWD